MTHDSTASGIADCRHKHYSLSCEEFEDLLRRANHGCEICKRPGVETGHKKLFIDHDPRIGLWAVRGLLCASCNSKLANDNVFSEEVEAYLLLPIRQRKSKPRRARNPNPRSPRTARLNELMTAMEEAEARAEQARADFGRALKQAREHPVNPVSQGDIARDLDVTREWLRQVQRRYEETPVA